MTNPDLAALSAAATPGTWDTDTIKSEGSYGSGDDTYEGFGTTAIYDPSGKVLFDALNSDAILVQEEWDEGGFCHAYDLTSAANAAFIVALVNAYRTGNLVQIDREGMRERVWHDYRFQAACHRYAHQGGSSEAIAAAAIAVILGGEQT